MLNKAILQGRLVANPELRHTQSGVAVASFRIACNRDYQSKDPNAQTADFINIVAWRSTGEFVSKYFTKGSMILIEGRIQVRDYTDNNGQKRYVTEVVADSVHFAASKRESEGGGNSGGGYSGGYGAPQQSTPTNYNGGGYGQQYGGNNAYAGQQTMNGYGPSGQNTNEFAELMDDDGELPF